MKLYKVFSLNWVSLVTSLVRVQGGKIPLPVQIVSDHVF